MEAAASSSRPDPYRPYLLVGHALGILMLIVICAEFARNYADPTSRDFISFWGAAKLAVAGTPELAYDLASLHAVQVKAAAFDPNTGMPFAYAPAFLLPVLPLAALPYSIAMAVWSLATLGIYALVARRFASGSQWLTIAFPPVFAIAAIGQNGFLTAALFLGGLALLERGKRFAAGLVLGCLIVKPQLALMLPFAMLASREWRVIAGAMVSAPTVLLIGLITFGPETSAAWIRQMPLFVEIAQDGLVGWHKLVSVYAAGRQAGLPEQVAFALHCAMAVIAAALVVRVWYPDGQFATKAAVLGAATMLASPYVYLYDALVLIPAFVWLVQRQAPVVLVGALWLLPMAVIAQNGYNIMPVNVAPILPITLLALCHLWGRERREVGADQTMPQGWREFAAKRGA
jgi:alpha-1,2-mannosyltransferase